MVVTEVSYGSECITDLIPQAVLEKKKPLMHTSTFRDSVTQGRQKNLSANKTMGPAKVQVPTPANFLKKGSRKYNDVKAVVSTREKRKPPVPTDQNDRPKPTNKDFIRLNAIENITSVPRKPKQQYVDTKDGHRNDLIASGLVPRFILKSEFGQVPFYLQNKNIEVKEAQEQYDAYVAERLREGALDQVTDERRADILAGLKKKWEDLHHQYQGLSVVTDTAPKKNRKERMEAAMSQLERDIDMLERHRVIYVAK